MTVKEFKDELDRLIDGGFITENETVLAVAKNGTTYEIGSFLKARVLIDKKHKLEPATMMFSVSEIPNTIWLNKE